MARILVDNQPVETLHAPLIARLDRLGPIAKEVGQFGAVLGREFGCDLIEEVARRPAAELRLGLAEGELLFCRRVAPQSSYLFAYGTLLRVWRQELHAYVTAVRERHFADLVERQQGNICRLDPNSYPKGVVVSDAEMAAINLDTADFHGEWNYTIAPSNSAPMKR